MAGFILAFFVTVVFLLYLHVGFKEAIFGFFYFIVTPFLAIVHFPVSIIIMIILLLLFRRVNFCMRTNLKWVAYALLCLHWIALGFYCSRYVSI